MIKSIQYKKAQLRLALNNSILHIYAMHPAMLSYEATTLIKTLVQISGAHEPLQRGPGLFLYGEWIDYIASLELSEWRNDLLNGQYRKLITMLEDLQGVCILDKVG